MLRTPSYLLPSCLDPTDVPSQQGAARESSSKCRCYLKDRGLGLETGEMIYRSKMTPNLLTSSPVLRESACDKPWSSGFVKGQKSWDFGPVMDLNFVAEALR